MADSEKGPKINRDSPNNDFIPLEEVKAILNQILSEETVSDIIKVLPMYPSSASSCREKLYNIR
jgi:hypothetical protein